jgi:outer membrane protein, heavy metal efflux system
MGVCLLLSVALAASPAPLALEQVLADVSERSPSVLVQREAVLEAEAGARVAGAWEDPLVSIMAEEIPLRRSEGPPMGPMMMYRVTQPLNLFGRRRLSRQAAGFGVEAERQLLRRVEWDARARAVALFYELWMADRMREVLRAQVALLQSMGQAALSRYRAGLPGAHHEYLRAQAEGAVLEADLSALEEERRAAAAMLNVLRGRDPEAPVGALTLPERSPPSPLEPLTARAAGRPELRQLASMRSQLQARERLAGRMYLPMVMVEAQFEQRRQLPDTLGGAVMFTVPLWWWDRQRPEIQLASATRRRAERELQAMEAVTLADLRTAHARTMAALRRLEALEQQSLPRLEETVASARASYMAGEVDFLSLLEASLALRMQQMAHLRAVAAHGEARFELSRLLAEDLEGAAP